MPCAQRTIRYLQAGIQKTKAEEIITALKRFKKKISTQIVDWYGFLYWLKDYLTLKKKNYEMVIYYCGRAGSICSL